MAFVTNAINFPNLTTKATPVGADLIPLSDSAAGNALKQATISSIIASGGASGMTLLATASANNVATVDFAGVITSTYDNYQIIVSNLLPINTAGRLFQVQVGTGVGPTYATANYTGNNLQCTGAGSVVAVASNTAVIDLNSLIGGAAMIGTPTTAVNAFRIFIFNAPNSVNNKNIECQGMWWTTGSADVVTRGTYRYNNATALTSLRFKFDTGNISSGNFKVYGFAN